MPIERGWYSTDPEERREFLNRVSAAMDAAWSRYEPTPEELAAVLGENHGE